jgi:hypothetical protein
MDSPIGQQIQEWGNKYKSKRDEITSNIYEINKVQDDIQYLHSAAGSPVSSKFTKAIEVGNFVTWPTLTAQHVRKYLEKSEATIKGHRNQKKCEKHTTKEKGNNTGRRSIV